VRRIWTPWFAILLGLLALAVSGCSLYPLLYDVHVEPDVISPNADGQQDITHIRYRLGRNANLSIYFVDEQGQRHYFRQERRRSAGKYDVFWGGVVNEPTVVNNGFGPQTVLSRMLPDGVYTWVIEATDDAGHTARAQGQITLQNADTEIPELRNFTVAPETFTPNQDGIDDRAGIGYFLSKPVESVQVYLLDPAKPDVKHPLAEQERAVKPKEAGYHYYDYDGGVDAGADPPPDGTYLVIGEAWDRVGHHVVVTSTLTIVEGGKPRADVVNGEIDWQGAVGSEMRVPLGYTIVFTTYVENYGRVPIRTIGPWPGQHYRSDQNFNTLAAETGHEEWHEQAGVWRFGIRFDVSETDFPYRWAVGRPEELERRIINGREQWYLLPGHRGTVFGSIELVKPPPREVIFAWGALIHEWVGISVENNNVDRVMIRVGVP